MRTSTEPNEPGERHTGLLAARIARHWTRRRPRRGLPALLGPGLITGASDDDPSGIATYSQAGAQFGYSMVWVMLFTWPLMAAIQEISARIGRVTGHGIAGNIRRYYPPWLLRGIVALLLAANIINLGADLGAMGEALRLLIGGPSHLYVVAFAVGCALLEVYVLTWTISASTMPRDLPKSSHAIPKSNASCAATCTAQSTGALPARSPALHRARRTRSGSASSPMRGSASFSSRQATSSICGSRIAA